MNHFYYYKSESTDPALNLAREAWLYDHLPEISNQGILLFYLNRPSFILGKSQNAFREIDWLRADQYRIPVHRRISGGGAVFHDEKNINISLIVPRKDEWIANFEPILRPLLKFLRGLGLDARLDNTSDLVLPEGKISGNAQALGKKQLLQHGTVLFDSDLHTLGEYLHHEREGFLTKAVASRQSRVVNCAEVLKAHGKQMSFEQFRDKLESDLILSMDAIEYSFSKEAEQEILVSAEERYRNWEWNFARSPKFILDKELEGAVFSIEVEKGRILEAKFDKEPKIAEALMGLPLRRKELEEALAFLGEERIRHILTCLFTPQSRIL